MSFIPRKQKFKKQQKGKSFNKITTVITLNNLKFGSFGLKALEFGRLTSRQMESVFQVVNKVIKKTGRVIMRVFPQTPVSNKPVEVRMGKGKGNIDHWVAKIKAGVTLCEIETSSSTLALKALNLARLRLPIRTKIFYQN